MDRTAERKAPSKPALRDDWAPTNERLWLAVLAVAKGKKRQMSRMSPGGELRTIHAPNKGRGFRHWPNEKAVAWAVKQYNGFGGRWRERGKEVEASSPAFQPHQLENWGRRIMAHTIVGRYKES